MEQTTKRAAKRTVQIWLLLMSCCATLQASQPNIVVILTDDLGWGDVGYQGGKIPTPHIDRIAREGLQFSDGHSSSAVCTPTRYSLLTGRYNWRSSLKNGVLWGDSPPLIEEDRATIASFLKQHGYATSVVGKWHLGLGWAKLAQARRPSEGAAQGVGWDFDYQRQVTGGPLALGFDESFIIPASLDMPPYVYLKDDISVGAPTVVKKFKVPARPGPATESFDAEKCLDDFTREARDFIRRHAKEKQPFFLYLPLTSPHTPILPTASWQGQSGLGEYADFVMQTDGVVGEILEELAEHQVLDNTLVIFTSDNGCSPMADIPSLEAQGHFPVGHLRGTKADIFEGGHRVPLCIRWPEKIAGGGVTSQTVCLVDLFATVADVIGELPSLPDDAAVDSFSWLPLFAEPTRQQPIRPFTIHHSINGSFAIRRGDWKLCMCPDSGGWSEPKPGSKAVKEKTLPSVQLYRLSDDPSETTNQAEAFPAVVAELTELLEQAKMSSGTKTSKQ